MHSIGLLLALFAAHTFPTFMTGSWRTTMPDGSVVEEHWTSADGGLMVGMGKTTPKSGDPEFEFLRVAMQNGKLTYLAMPSAKAATPFPMTSLTDSRVVFENPQHDFPQRIIYWRDGERLCARVEDKKGAGEEWCWSKIEPPAPVVQATPRSEVTRYTLVGVINTNNTCPEPTPSAVHLTVTLANAEHKLTTPPMRIGLEGRSYTFQLDWKNEWGQPTEWRDIKATRFDESPFCANGQQGAVPFSAPVTGVLVKHGLELRCACDKK